jgi:hypothetical protein
MSCFQRCESVRPDMPSFRIQPEMWQWYQSKFSVDVVANTFVCKLLWLTAGVPAVWLFFVPDVESNFQISEQFRRETIQ